MTMSEFCDRTHLTGAQVYTLRAAGLIRPDMPASQVEFARLIKALQSKGAKLSKLARADLAGLAGKAFVVYDGNELRACRGDRHGGQGETSRGRPTAPRILHSRPAP